MYIYIYIYIYLHAVFKNVANLKIHLKYLYLLIPHQKETLFDMKTKDIYWIYIFGSISVSGPKAL